MIDKPKQVVNDSLFDDLKSMHKHYEKEEKEEIELGFSPEVKRKTLLSLLVTLGIGNMQVANLAIVLPAFTDKSPDWTLDEYGIASKPSSNNIAVILAAFSLAQVLFSPFNSLIKNSIGTKNTILLGFFLVTITTIGLGSIAHITNGTYFTYTAIILRFFQGAGDILLQITAYGVICTMFSDNLMKYIGYLEIVVGLGASLGPALG